MRRDESTHREQYRIRSAEVDPNARATPPSITKLLQEAAASHARKLGFGVESLQGRGLTWYLKRLHLRLRRMPWFGETMEVETWPAAVDSLFAVRDYRLFLDGGLDAVEIGSATSGWLLMDVESGKPLRRLPEDLLALHPDPPRRALDEGFERLPSLPEECLVERSFPLRRSDLDVNRHVNHGVFVDALMEAVPEELWSDAELQELEVDFRAEALPGDDLLVRAAVLDEDDEDAVTVLLGAFRADDGHELVRARSRWRRDA